MDLALVHGVAKTVFGLKRLERPVGFLVASEDYLVCNCEWSCGLNIYLLLFKFSTALIVFSYTFFYLNLTPQLFCIYIQYPVCRVLYLFGYLHAVRPCAGLLFQLITINRETHPSSIGLKKEQEKEFNSSRFTWLGYLLKFKSFNSNVHSYIRKSVQKVLTFWVEDNQGIKLLSESDKWSKGWSFLWRFLYQTFSVNTENDELIALQQTEIHWPSESLREREQGFKSGGCEWSNSLTMWAAASSLAAKPTLK